MPFDWFTVTAQIINFLILVWLMKRFLYKPILDALDAREKLIAAKLADAEEQKTQAHEERDTFQQKNETLDLQRETLLNEATQAAQTEHQRLLNEAQQEADDMRVKRQKGLEREQHALIEEIGRQTRAEVFAIARKSLRDLAEESLEERIVTLFLTRLTTLDSDAKASFNAALKASSQPLRVRSAFDLTAEQQKQLIEAIHNTLNSKSEVSFDTNPELISGIELSANGWKVAWNISDYLTALENNIDQLLQPAAATPEVTQ